MDEPNTLAQRFAQALAAAEAASVERKEQLEKAEKVHVVGAGSFVTAAYEQLRNAAEYAEDHLLLQKAIRRFYRRVFLTQSAESIAKSGSELVTELTFAGYLANDSVAELTIIEINRLAVTYHEVFSKIQTSDKVVSSRGEAWAIDVLSVEAAQLLRPAHTKEAFAQFAFDYFKQTMDKAEVFGPKTPEDFDPALFSAIHKTLLKSDPALIRASLLGRYGVSPSDFAAYCHVNAEIHKLLDSETNEKLIRYVDRYGAPLRIILRMLENKTDVAELLPRKTKFINAFESQVEDEYAAIGKRINRGIVKSVIFLIITKFIVGIALEVPYDYMVHGHIIMPALLFNLLFPPVYMVLLRTTLALPKDANTKKLVSQVEDIFYTESPKKQLRRKASFNPIYNVFYVLLMLVVFFGASWLLVTYLHFEIPHLVVFFIFLSGASFLGFRLSRMIRELESIDSQQNTVTLVRDFLYMPFVVVGRWINEKYAKVNFVSQILDMVIELPLKTILRLIRQWSAFISNKKDQL